MSLWKKLGFSLMLILIIGGLGFQDVSKDPNRSSIVWQHFILDEDKEKAKCKHCGKEFKFPKGGSTKGMLKHLKESKVHSNLKLNNDTEGESESTITSQSSTKDPDQKEKTVKDYFPSNKMSVQQIVTDLAISGASFNFIATCETLKKSFRDNGYDMPNSHNTVRKYVLSVANARIEKLIEDVKKDKSKGIRLSLSLDEYTAKNNRKYLGMNIHQNGSFYNLGIQRIHGSMPSEKLGDLVDESLAKFDLNLDRDFTCVTNDAASVMVKWARQLPCLSLKCIVHGIHLSIVDILYKKEKKKKSASALPTQSHTQQDLSDSDDDYDDINGTVSFPQLPERQGSIPMVEKYDPILTKVRGQNRKYRKSQVRNDELQEFVKNGFGKELAVLKDCKTRWSSLVKMLNRFIGLSPYMRMANIARQEFWPFTRGEIDSLRDLTAALEPLENAVTALSSRSANIIDAETIYEEVMSEFDQQDTWISNELKKSFVKRVKERRNVTLTHLVLYLQDPSYIQKDEDQFEEEIGRTAILLLAKKLVSRLFPEYSTVNDDAIGMIVDDSETQIDIQEQTFNQRLQTKLQQARSKKPASGSSNSNGVENEFKKFEQNPQFRPPILEKLYEALKGIPVSSVEAERVFSTTGNFSTKLRSRLGDEILSALVFLKHNSF